MSEAVHLVHLNDPANRDRLVAELRALVRAHADRSLVAATLPGGIDAGDLIVRLRIGDETRRRSAQKALDAWFGRPFVQRVETATFPGDPARVPHHRNERRGTPGVYRALLVAVDPGTDPALVARFESETAAMPDYIHTIGASRLSRVAGGSGWTHVWEQEFTDVGGLTGPYMTHPYHWAHIDRWFDAERGTKIVTRLCHSFAALDRALLSAP